MNKNRALLGLILSVSSVGVFAEDQSQPHYPEISNGFFVSAGQVSFDSKTAQEEGVSDSATYWRLGWEGQRDAFVYGAGLSGYMYSDKEDFEQDIESRYGGDRDTADSSAIAINLFAEGGYSHAFNENVALEILGGLEQVLSSERSIGNCSNCYEEDIDINGGLYIAPRIRFSTGDMFSFLLEYHSYFGGDVENVFAATFSWQF